MVDSLDVSLHGTQRVEIIERLVHICRYSPGLVLFDGEPGVSPVNFLRHMADLLRDELDFALLDSSRGVMGLVVDALISQWHVYCSEDEEGSNVQRIHHFLDVGKDAGRMALIVVEHAAALEDDVLGFLIDLMARHSRLTVLFSGIVEPRALLRRTWQAEVPVHRIELPEGLPVSTGNNRLLPTRSLKGAAAVQVDPGAHTSKGALLGRRAEFSAIDEFAYSTGDLFSGHEIDSGLAASRRDGVAAGVSDRVLRGTTNLASQSQPALGVSIRLSDLQTWGARTFKELRGRRPSHSLLILSIGALVILLLLALRDSRETTATVSRDMVLSQAAPTARANQDIVQAMPSGLVAPPPVVGKVETPREEITPLPVGVSGAEKTGGSSPAVGGQTGSTQVSLAVKPPVPVATKAVSVTKSRQGVAKHESAEKIWRSHPEKFTVQLAVLRSESAATALASKLPKDQPHYIQQTKKNGGSVFVLIYGSFSTREAAIQSKDRLPVALKKGVSPWVRKQGEVFGH